MSDSSEQDRIELDVKDFGPIVEAKIDLRPLTVFVGPSNTGKSCLATLIYALHQCFNGDAGTDYRRSSQGTRTPPRIGRERQQPGEIIEAFVKSTLGRLLLREFIGGKKSPAEESIPLPGPLLDEIRYVFNVQGAEIDGQIGRCFGIGTTGALIRKGSREGARVVFRRCFSDDSKPVEHTLVLREQGPKFQGVVPENMSLPKGKLNDIVDEYFRHVGEDILESILGADKNSDFLAWNIIKSLENFVRNRVVGPLGLPAYFLPCERIGVMHAHDTMVGTMIGHAATTGLRRTARAPMLSGVLADFLQQILEIDRSRSGDGNVKELLVRTAQLGSRAGRTRPGDGNSLSDIGARIGESILDGNVYVERSGPIGHPNFMYQPKGWKNAIPLKNASSMVSELAPVVLYLRHLVLPGDVLIIEEPESSLHPAMQVELIRQIAALVRAGVRVILTTHSEWVLEELANVVRRSELCEAHRKEIANGEDALRPDQVGAWLFKPKRRPKGSVVEELKPDDETGLYPTDYDPISEALYNENVEIYNRIQDGSAE